MSGNDFDIDTDMSITPSWEAVLQLDRHSKKHFDKTPYDRSSQSLPLCSKASGIADVSSAAESSRVPIQYTQYKLQPMVQEEALEHVQQAASLLDSSWPDATIGPSRLRQLGPSFSNPESMDYCLFRWLASKQLNPVYEGVFMMELFVLDGALLQALRQKIHAMSDS